VSKPASFQELLIAYARGALSLEAFRARIRELGDVDIAQLSRWIAAVKAEVAAGNVSERIGRSVLDMLTLANSATRVAEERTVVQAPAATLLRSEPSAATALLSDATLGGAEAPVTQAHAAPAPQATLVRNPEQPEPRPTPVDRTQVITERLVRSLDQIETAHQGPLRAGAVIKNRFVLEKVVGKGGMGLVFSAIDRRKQELHDPNPHVAFKVLNADFERHPQSLIALQREARKAQTLAHPNVVTVFDFDRDGDTVYMTMELLHGRPLEAFVREARGVGIEPRLAVSIIRGIAEGLAYAHRKGIVHSDLKPGNIFILEDGTPKILDFGIARAVPSGAASEAADMFDAGVLGAYTEAYATDEMVEGDAPHPTDDMYALGIIGYELITGFHPYDRHSAPEARKLGIKPPPLKGLKLREARALERCLSFDRKQRPQNAGEFLQAFRGVTRLQQVTLAATIVLALAAGYFSYESHREASPAVPFDELPLAIREQFRDQMAQGDRVLGFYLQERNTFVLNDAVEHYVAAYALHERNREATRALNRVADVWLDAAKNAAEKRQIAHALLGRSDYYLRYPPVVAAANDPG
jgi:hypothetical protein